MPAATEPVIDRRLLIELSDLCAEAGRAILDVYGAIAAVREKADRSPVTDADERAEVILLAGLEKLLPGIPVLAEETVSREGLPPLGEVFLLVDPLDGTREFLAKNGEFTVNVGLVAHGVPIMGCVHAPALGKTWIGAQNLGAESATAAVGATPAAESFVPIGVRPRPARSLVAVASRSHSDPETEAFLSGLPIGDRRSAGSSLKFCLVAEGEADVYPRFGPTMEWDTAAGNAVLLAAGGSVLNPDGSPFRYGKKDAGYRNGAFVAWGAGGV
jgi:3'(2'), 5'-bisphosphate nucleotidase